MVHTVVIIWYGVLQSWNVNSLCYVLRTVFKLTSIFAEFKLTQMVILWRFRWVALIDIFIIELTGVFISSEPSAN